jgi:SAM-dependent methyltransferase
MTSTIIERLPWGGFVTAYPRSAETHAAALLPHLRAGMVVLDLGCGHAAITTGLADAVRPGLTIGLDIAVKPPVDGSADRLVFVTADAHELPFRDESVDAINACGLLQRLRDPIAVLREARRVARPGAVIAVSDIDWDAELIYPSSPLLRRSRDITRRLRRETSPYVGKRLRWLLIEAGFARCVASARAVSYGGPDEVREFADATAAHVEAPLFDRAVDAGWTTPDERASIVRTWRAWGEEPGAFVARVWCEAVGWADD